MIRQCLRLLGLIQQSYLSQVRMRNYSGLLEEATLGFLSLKSKFEYLLEIYYKHEHTFCVNQCFKCINCNSLFGVI